MNPIEPTDDWHLTYDTEIASGVIGHLEWSEVESYLDQIAALEATA